MVEHPHILPYRSGPSQTREPWGNATTTTAPAPAREDQLRFDRSNGPFARGGWAAWSNAKCIRSGYQVGPCPPHAEQVNEGSDPRKATGRAKRPGSGAQPPYDVNIPEKTPEQRELSIRKRLAELSKEDPDRFFAVIRDADRRERDGNDPVTALEKALKAIDTATPGNDKRRRK